MDRLMGVKLAAWNIRGLCCDGKQKEVKKLINEEKLQFFGCSGNTCVIP